MSNQSPAKVPVSERAIEARIKRALKAEGYSLKRNRSARYENDLGRMYTVHDSTNSIEATHLTLDKLARELKVLKPYEVIQAD